MFCTTILYIPTYRNDFVLLPISMPIVLFSVALILAFCYLALLAFAFCCSLLLSVA